MACNVVAVPYPGRGHVNAMMNLCNLLASSTRHHLLITFVVTEEWLRLIQSDINPTPTIRFATIPNVLPSEFNRSSDMVGFVTATQTMMEAPFQRLLDRLASPVSLIIADTFLNWAVDLGNRRNIPVASLWPMPAAVFSIFYHFDLIVRNGHYPFELSERGNERLDYIPGIQSIRLADIPSLAAMKDPRLLNLVLGIFPNVSRAQYLLFNSIYELESEAVDALKQEFPFPVYTVGPAIPYSDLQPKQIDPTIDWLNSQPPGSVLYLSLGSFLSVSTAQMEEIAEGLRQSGVRFLWVARGDAAELVQRRCGDAGRVVHWCKQLRVLCHIAIGGFWTHCGWNSGLEVVYAGVPIIAFPISMDQPSVRKHIVEDWGIGWDAWRDVGDGKLLRSCEIAEMVRKFMDLESGERREMVGRVEEVKKACLGAVSDGGSSKVNLSCFLNQSTSLRSCRKDNLCSSS